MGCPEWKKSIPTLRPIRKTSLPFGGHVLGTEILMFGLFLPVTAVLKLQARLQKSGLFINALIFVAKSRLK